MSNDRFANDFERLGGPAPSMTRAEHYARAMELLAPIEARMMRERFSRATGAVALLQAHRDDLLLAQLHATLAVAAQTEV